MNQGPHAAPGPDTSRGKAGQVPRTTWKEPCPGQAHHEGCGCHPREALVRDPMTPSQPAATTPASPLTKTAKRRKSR